MTTLIKLGVSACLLGENVRYDGGHKHDRYITDTLGPYFSFLPICPEVECGLSTPREAMQLEGDPSSPRLMTRRTRTDITAQMLAYCSARIRELESEDLCGFILKERSPSCGLATVPLHGCSTLHIFATGLFASEITRRFPLMPVEEAERLTNQNIRTDFIERVLRYHWARESKNNTCSGRNSPKAEHFH